MQNDRELYFLSIDRLESMPVDIEHSIAHFACLIACDARSYSTEAISQFVEKLLNLGCVYFCTWGPDCQRVHDIIDEIAAYPETTFSMPDDPVIMTSWHDDEPLAEAFYFFCNCAWPADGYEETLKSALAISVGSDSWENELKGYLNDPEGFTDTFEYDE